MSAGIILFAAFAVCLIVGVPVSISLGVASLCSVVFGGLSASSTVIAQRIFGGLQSTSIMAIAFFVLAGNLMTKGGISRRIVNFANCLVGNVRGGMSLALVLACAFFAALSGSAPATVIAIGTMLYNDMVTRSPPVPNASGKAKRSSISFGSFSMAVSSSRSSASRSLLANHFLYSLMKSDIYFLLLRFGVYAFCSSSCLSALAS